LEFIQVLNSHHPSIRIKWELRLDGIDFLDTTVYKGPKFLQTGRLDAKVFLKPTDTHALLHHDRHVFREVVKAQLLRFRRICTREVDRVEAAKILRGYTWSFLRKVAREEKEMSGGTVVVPQKRILTVVLRFSNTAKVLTARLRRNCEELSQKEVLCNRWPIKHGRS